MWRLPQLSAIIGPTSSVNQPLPTPRSATGRVPRILSVMARPVGVLLLSLVLVLGGLAILGLPGRTLRAQVTWANEPTYRYAGSYRGEWVSDAYDLSVASLAGG